MSNIYRTNRSIYRDEEEGHHDRRPNHQPWEQLDVVPIRTPMDHLVLGEPILQ